MTTHATSAYKHLHERMAAGSLRPGDVISESELAKEMGCSRTPVGEALRILSDEGLVQQVPRYGTIVRELPAAELVELFEVREAIELFAARKAAERIADSTLTELESVCALIDKVLDNNVKQGAECVEGDALRRFLAADMAFHMLIIAASGNARLLKIARQTKSVALIFQSRRGSHSLERVQQANVAHWGILDALKDRDADKTCGLLAKHIKESRQVSVGGVIESGEATSLSQLDLLHALDED